MSLPSADGPPGGPRRAPDSRGPDPGPAEVGISTTRRKVLASLALLAAAFGLGARRPGVGDDSGQEAIPVGPLRDLPDGGAVQADFHGLPLLVVRRGEEVTALSAMCTHEGCVLDWSTGRGIIVCPCHGGEFDSTGNVLAGPPPAALLRFSVQIDQGHVYILGPQGGD